MSALEIVSNFFNLAAVLLAARNHRFTWPVGIIGCVLFGALFYEAKLYADVTLQLFFIGTSIYGWWHWQQKSLTHVGPAQELPISRMKVTEALLCAVGALLTAGAYGAVLHTYTDAALPFADSVVLMFSVIGQLLLMRRKIETWLFWILTNTVAAPVYFAKDLKLTGFIYVVFWFTAIYGFWTWRKEYLKAKST